MSDRYQGGIIRATPLEPTSEAASGVWTMEQQAKAEAAGNWPSPPPPPYIIDRSLRFNSADSANLSRTFSTTGTNLKIRTLSVWIKRVNFGVSNSSIIQCYNGSSSYSNSLEFNSSDQLYFGFGGASATELVSSNLFRDPSAWYHIVCAIDTTQATASDRVKLYVNGVQISSFSTANYPSQNADSQWGSANANNKIGSQWNDTGYVNAYMTEINFIDGQQLTPSDFGQTNATTGVWEPIAYAGTYGTNGFHLDFSDNTSTTTIGYDTSGNGNNWTANNFSVTAGAGNDSLVDTPTPYGTDTGVGGEVGGNYATWNPLDNKATLANGNLYIANAGESNQAARSTFAMPLSGKYYAEFTVGSTTNGNSGIAFGFSTPSVSLTQEPTGTGKFILYSDSTGYLINQTSFISTSLGSFAAGTVLQVAYDASTGYAWVGKNNSWYDSSGGTTGNPAAGSNQTFTISSGTQLFLFSLCYANNGNVNFGQRPFAYTAPSGFKALCTTNLPEPDVVQGDTAFNTVLYTGTGASLGVTGVGFQPDFTWIKSRSDAVGHIQVDVLRGATKYLQSNNTNGEGTDSNVVASFGADGFTVGSDATTGGSGSTYVAWNWKAGGSGVSNTDGSITSTVSANPTAGFSIVTYTGTGSAATVGHGIGIAPKFIITKKRSNTSNWATNDPSQTNPWSGALLLNGTQAFTSSTAVWNDTAPTSTVFSIGSADATNVSSENYVAYCFAQVEGFSAMGSWTGNGSADGPFIYTGFRPAFIILKESSTTRDWVMLDDKRNAYNGSTSAYLYPDLTLNEQNTTAGADFLSNGFKVRTTNTELNQSSGTYIYMAFAENPFKYALAR